MEREDKTRASGLLTRLKSRFQANSFIGNVLVLSGGTVLAQGITVVVSPALTRLYRPDDFGVLMVFGSLSSILLLVSSFRYEAAILLPEDDQSSANVLAVCFLLVFFMSILTGFGIWLMGSFICELTRTPSLQPYLMLLPVSLLGAGSYQILSHWAMRKRDFRRLARTRLIQSMGQAAVQVGLGLLGLGPPGLLLGFIVGQASGSGSLAFWAIRRNKQAFRHISLSGMFWALRRYRRFPLLSAGPALLNGIGLQLPGLMLTFLYGARVAGLFSLSQRVLGIPVTLLGASVAQVFFAEAANLAKKSPQNLEKLLYQSLRNMFLIGAPVTLLVAFGIPGIIPFVFGPEWKEAGVYLQPLSMVFLMQFVANTVGGIIDVLERQDIHLLRELTRIFLITGSLFLASHFLVGPTTAVILLSVAGSAGYGLSVFLSWRAIKKVGRLYDKS